MLLDSEKFRYGKLICNMPALAAVMIIIFIQSSAVFAEMPTGMNSQKAAPINELVEGLKSKLEQNPDDMQGWVLLGKSYHYLEQFQEAENAFKKAKTLGYQGELPSIKKQTPTPLTLRIKPAGNDWLANYVNKQTTEKNDNAKPPSHITYLDLVIDIDDALKNKIDQNRIVYVFAKEQNKTGPPLAVRQISVKELPAQIRLDDSSAIIPNHTISLATNIIAGARISASGSAQRMPGDYETFTDTIITNSGQKIKLLLDKSTLVQKGQ